MSPTEIGSFEIALQFGINQKSLRSGAIQFGINQKSLRSGVAVKMVNGFNGQKNSKIYRMDSSIPPVK